MSISVFVYVHKEDGVSCMFKEVYMYLSVQ